MSELLLETDLINRQDIDIDGGADVIDPQLSVDQVISSVHDALRRLEIMFGADWHDLEVFLQTMESDLDLTIDELWRRVDCDVYYLYLNGELSHSFYKRWFNDLWNWKCAMIEAAKRFEGWKRRSLFKSFSIMKKEVLS